MYFVIHVCDMDGWNQFGLERPHRIETDAVLEQRGGLDDNVVAGNQSVRCLEDPFPGCGCAMKAAVVLIKNRHRTIQE